MKETKKKAVSYIEKIPVILQYAEPSGDTAQMKEAVRHILTQELQKQLKAEGVIS